MGQILVTKSNFEECVNTLKAKKVFSLDTETTGLRPFQGDRLFMMTASTKEHDYCFNWNFYPDISPDLILDDRHKQGLKELFQDPLLYVFMHNAKFDMHMLKAEDIDIEGTVHCTMAIARVVHNDLIAYNLGALSKKYLEKDKDKKVDEYIKKHKLYGKDNSGDKKPQFFLVPFDIMSTYAMNDTRVTLELGWTQLDHIQKWDDSHKFTPSKRLDNILQNELKLTKTLFHVEREGIKIDIPYCIKQKEIGENICKETLKSYEEISGIPFIDSNKNHAEAFTKLGLPFPRTEKGNPSFKKDMLKTLSSPIARSIQDYRKQSKFVTSYYSKFLDYADDDGILHTSFFQGGASTGRMSARNPALQTIPKEDPEKIGAPVRRCFIPNDEEYCFFMPDFDQMEYRYLMDFAQETKVIDQILGGMDVHTATALQLGIPRSEAKTLNFALIYGSGIPLLAKQLDIRQWDAKVLKNGYFRNLPHVTKLVSGIKATAEDRGYLVNNMGRVYDFSREGFHKTCNYLVQGSTADIVKVGLNRLHDFLQGRKSKILLQVHDEIVFKIHRSELAICPEIVRIMETVYIPKRLGLTCGAEYSWKSMVDKVEGYPVAA